MDGEQHVQHKDQRFRNGRLYEEMEFNSYGVFYRRWDDDGNLVISRRATNEDWLSKHWSSPDHP